MNEITHIRHQSIPTYLSAIREKVAHFGREALAPYADFKSLAIGFQCENEIHAIGINTIRAHYNIQRTLFNIPNLVSIKRTAEPAVSQQVGMEMFFKDCKEALSGK